MLSDSNAVAFCMYFFGNERTLENQINNKINGIAFLLSDVDYL